MEENMLYLTGLCPYCSAALDYREDARAVKCHACGATLPTSRLELYKNTSDSGENTQERQIAEGVLSAEAALAYVSNFLEEYDWACFAESAKLTIPLLDAISENCKLKFSTDPVTYILDFRRIAVPVLKKIECLDLIEVEMIDNYRSDDISDLYEYFDTYSAITHAVVDSRDAFYKELTNDIKLASKFGADRMIINELERSLDVFDEKVRAIKAISELDEIEMYRQAKLAKDAKLVEKLRESGLDAEKTYEKALQLLDDGNVDSALHLLHAIAGYKDTQDIVKSHSRTYSFNNEFVEMAGRRYILERRESFEFDLKKPTEYTPNVLFSLYEIVGGVPSSVPSITQISKLIGCHGSRIFYIRNDETICCFETNSELLYANVRELDNASMRGDYVYGDERPIRFSTDRSKFYVLKKLRDEVKRGCFGRKKKVKSVGFTRQNNYAVVLVDMDTVMARTVLPSIVDVMYYFDDKIFYTTISAETGAQSFRICNILDGSNDAILDMECVIHNVVGGKVIYSLWAPSCYNMDLYSIDIETKEKTLIDTNIQDYRETHLDRIFYTVGSEDYNRLYSANLDGTDKQEIMENAGRILSIRSGWIYYVSGEGRNACLMKVSADGEKHTLIASRFDRLVKRDDGCIYYVTTNDELHVVRTDGRGDRLIMDSVAKARIIIDDAGVYCLRSEYVGEIDGDEDGMAYSLYFTDLRGRNLKKIAFGVVSISEYNEGTIYFCKKRTVQYTVSTPVGKEGYDVSVITRDVKTYCSLEKASGKIETILTLGVPTASSITVKAGCFRKKVRNALISEMPREIASVIHKGAKRSGDVLNEEIEDARLEREAIAKRKQDKKDEKREIKDAKRDAKRSHAEKMRAEAIEQAKRNAGQ
ncbi:MAG: DUF5050 domain-containing protein [Clostridia bacterium]|nr:DUF5050 domain-containing protein [Clostridia bacterium]